MKPLKLSGRFGDSNGTDPNDMQDCGGTSMKNTPRKARKKCWCGAATVTLNGHCKFHGLPDHDDTPRKATLPGDKCKTCGAKREWLPKEREQFLKSDLLRNARHTCAECYQKEKAARATGEKTK